MKPLKHLFNSLLRGAARVRDRIVQRPISHDEFQPIAKFQATDVFVVGYPKSGNTWCQAMLSGLLYGAIPSFTPDRLVQELVPDVHHKKVYKRFGDIQFFKTHGLPDPTLRRVIYLVRDGRDAMVSYHHHLSSLPGQSVTWANMIEHGTGLFPCHWHEHVEAWLANPYAADILIVKYEDLINDRVTQLQRICEFSRIERPRELIAKIALDASFLTMQARESTFGWDSKQWPCDKKFIRRGEAGNYAEEFPAELLALFTAQAQASLAAFDYWRPAEGQSPAEK